jgi:hypothetical protein
LHAVHAEVLDAEAMVAQAAAAHPIARAPDTMVGIGPVRALTLRAEIGDIARFRRGGVGELRRVSAACGQLG